MKTCLYRHFSSDGKLLYAGISIDRASRTYTHLKTAPWKNAISSITFEFFDSVEDAMIAEGTAILQESPAFNKKGGGRNVKVPVCLRIKSDLVDLLEAKSKELGINKTRIVELALAEWLAVKRN